MTKKIQVQYYSEFRDHVGKPEESFQTEAKTAEELYEDLKKQYNFSINPKELKVAVNCEFAEMTAALKDGDTVTFIPPNGR